MVGLPDFRSHLKFRPISNPHCSRDLVILGPFSQLTFHVQRAPLSCATVQIKFWLLFQYPDKPSLSSEVGTCDVPTASEIAAAATSQPQSLFDAPPASAELLKVFLLNY